MMVSLLYSTIVLLAAPEPLSVQQYSAQSQNAALYVLPAAHAVAPHIVILDDTTLTVYPANTSRPLFTHTIPADTLMFDLVDTNDDFEPELFTLSPDALHHHSGGAQESITQLFPIEPPLPWKVEQPFLHSLIVSYLDAYHAAIPYLDTITLKDFKGEVVTTFPKVLSTTETLFSLPIHPNQVGHSGAFEFRVDTMLTTPIEVPQALRSTMVHDSYEPLSPRKLRESETLELELWPQFPLRVASEGIPAVLYASHAPEHVNTVIRLKQQVLRSTPNTAEPYRFSSKRIYPGTMAIAESGLPDFNQDGYHDLVLWNIPLPGHSTSALLNSLQRQNWPLNITIHLFDPEKGLYEARPKARIKTHIALQYLFTRQSHSPLHNLSFADMNQDGASDLVFSPTPEELEVWCYQDGFNATPEYRSHFENPVSLIAVPKQEMLNQAHSILLRDKTSIYRLSVPFQD